MEAHVDNAGGHYIGQATAQKILHAGLWWPTLHQDSKEHYKAYDICQRIGKPLQRNDMHLNTQITLQPFEKWAIDFVGPIKPQGKMDMQYIIIVTKYLTGWVEVQSVKDYTTIMAENFLFEHVLTRFGYPKILMSDHGTHFLNKTISTLIKEFEVYHHKSTQYHPQANGIVQAFNKIQETVLTKVCNVKWIDWDLRVPAILWAYRTTWKKLMGQTPFRFIYGMEVVMPMEYIVPSLRIEMLTGMTDREALEERLA